MNSTKVAICSLFVLAIATLPFTTSASPLLSNDNSAVPQPGLYNIPQGSQESYQNHLLQKKWSRLEPSIRFFKRSQPAYPSMNQREAYDFANRFMLF